MTLAPFFSLTPLNPQDYTYDAAQPNAPYASAYMFSFGGMTKYYNPYRLADQHNNDEINLGYDPVDPTDQTISNIVNDVYRRSALQISFYGYNVSTENQYLLLFSLRSMYGTPSAQFFVGTELVRIEELSGEEQVAILLDVPGNAVYTTVYVRLASTAFTASMGLKGMDCYLL
jgi:hypothetical protein